MIQRFQHSSRRILSLPAVNPCVSISPETLLRSLIDLSRNICSYRSRFFPTQRRNSRETIRQIVNLLIFFDEIQECSTQLSDSVVLCFTELHFTFQKIHFLLEDCLREGARLWLLIKSEFIAAQFRVLVRTIATALDVLPLDSIEICGEVKELVELVAKQARKVRIEVEPGDEKAMRRVVSMVKQFERGTEPELEFMEWVLDYLRIRSWNDCHKEVKFLEEEISFQYLDGEEREVPFLSSLLGFMSYCRGVIFDSSDFLNSDQIESRSTVESLNCLNPEDFRCPISLELMIDPVTVSSGQTYDRSSIRKWLEAGNLICPKTGERLRSTELVPNTALRKLIHQFCTDNGISLAKSGRRARDITRTIVAGSAAAAASIKCLSKFLAERLFLGSSKQKNKAAYEIRLLGKANIFNRSCLVKAGTIPPLLHLLRSPDRSTQENAIAALLKLAKHAIGKKIIIETDGLLSVIAVLRRGLSLEARQIAAATIFYLSSVKGYRRLIGEIPEAIPALVELIQNGTTCGKKNGVVAIFGLLLYRPNHGRVLRGGAVPVLMDILGSSDNTELTSDAVAVLSALAENIEGAFAILQNSGLRLICRILRSSTSRAAKEHCVSVLVSLCDNGGDQVIAVLAKDSSLIDSLYLLITDGTSHASKKARLLLKILHNFSEESSSR